MKAMTGWMTALLLSFSHLGMGITPEQVGTYAGTTRGKLYHIATGAVEPFNAVMTLTIAENGDVTVNHSYFGNISGGWTALGEKEGAFHHINSIQVIAVPLHFRARGKIKGTFTAVYPQQSTGFSVEAKVSLRKQPQP